MKVAIIILAHNKPEQLNRLIRHLKHDDIDIFIHIDKKNNSMKKHIDINSPNIKVINNSVSVYWGTFSQIQATLNSLEEARIKNRYDYYFLLSGQDYPIKTTEYILNFLKNSKGMNFIEFKEIYEKGWGSERLSKYYYILLRELNSKYLLNTSWFGKRVLYRIIQEFIVFLENSTTGVAKLLKKKPTDFLKIPLYGGSQWWILSSEAIDCIMKYIGTQESFVKGMKRSLIPDEVFFQTILSNSDLVTKMENKNYRYIVMEEGRFHPKILTMEDYDKLIKSDCIFARKFDDIYDSKVLDLIHEYLQPVK
jgi:hypothetical protein